MLVLGSSFSLARVRINPAPLNEPHQTAIRGIAALALWTHVANGVLWFLVVFPHANAASTAELARANATPHVGLCQVTKNGAKSMASAPVPLLDRLRAKAACLLVARECSYGQTRTFATSPVTVR